jgi:hypothetical protein
MFDQALLSGARADSTQPLLPIDRDILKKFVEDYKKNVVTIPRREAFSESSAESMSRKLEESETAALSQISQRLPADIIWLYRHMSFGGDPPAGNNVMDKTINQGTTVYLNLTKALLDRRFSSVQPDQHYQSIFDLNNLFNIYKYRINKLY